MTVMIQVPPEVENILREQAAARGKDASQYASEIVVQALQTAANGQQQVELRAAVEEFLQRVENLVSDPSRPHLKGSEAEIEQMIAEKFRKQWLRACTCSAGWADGDSSSSCG